MHWDVELIAGARLGQRSGNQSDSIKDSKQQELIEKEGRWVESQILPPHAALFILKDKAQESGGG